MREVEAADPVADVVTQHQIAVFRRTPALFRLLRLGQELREPEGEIAVLFHLADLYVSH